MPWHVLADAGDKPIGRATAEVRCYGTSRLRKSPATGRDFRAETDNSPDWRFPMNSAGPLLGLGSVSRRAETIEPERPAALFGGGGAGAVDGGRILGNTGPQVLLGSQPQIVKGLQRRQRLPGLT